MLFWRFCLIIDDQDFLNLEIGQFDKLSSGCSGLSFCDFVRSVNIQTLTRTVPITFHDRAVA